MAARIYFVPANSFFNWGRFICRPPLDGRHSLSRF
nr:MAG TPA: hypothetical protein [Caudoviricetes sp.]